MSVTKDKMNGAWLGNNVEHSKEHGKISTIK